MRLPRFRSCFNASPALYLIAGVRLWQAGAGLVTTLLAVHFLSPTLQGWYYGFLSVAALYTLFDLGLSTVLVQVSAHRFVALRWASYRVAAVAPDLGEPATRSNDEESSERALRLFHAMTRASLHWYGRMSFIFAALLLPCGLLFFNSKPVVDVPWAAPWVALCMVTAASLTQMPLLAILEGSGRIAQVYGVRLAQSVMGSIACWAILAAGGGLWATLMVPLMNTLVPFVWLYRSYRPFIAEALRASSGAFEWRQEIWPLQWRVGANWACGYLLTQINIPILFHTQSPVVAGRLGLSLAIVNTIGLLSQSWLLRRVPAMAHAASVRDWPLLDGLFRRDFLASNIVFVIGAISALCIAWWFRGHSIAQRLLPTTELLGLFAFAFANQLIGGLATQLRSFRREPLVWLILATTIITIPISFFMAARYSSAGLVATLAAMNCIVTLPIAIIIWYYCNRIWRKT